MCNLSDCLNLYCILRLVTKKWGGRSLPSLPYSYGLASYTYGPVQPRTQALSGGVEEPGYEAMFNPNLSGGIKGVDRGGGGGASAPSPPF